MDKWSGYPSSKKVLAEGDTVKIRNYAALRAYHTACAYIVKVRTEEAALLGIVTPEEDSLFSERDQAGTRRKLAKRHGVPLRGSHDVHSDYLTVPGPEDAPDPEDEDREWNAMVERSRPP